MGEMEVAMKKLVLVFVGGCVLSGKLYGACTPEQPCIVMGQNYQLRVTSLAGVGNLNELMQPCDRYCRMCKPCEKYLDTKISCEDYKEKKDSQALCIFAKSDLYKQHCVHPKFCFCEGE